MTNNNAVLLVFNQFEKDVVAMSELAAALADSCSIADELAWEVINRAVADRVLLLNGEGQLRRA